MRHQRTPTRAPSGPDAAVPARAARRLSRSTTRQPKPASTKTARKMSSSAKRLCTIDSPSTASSNPATQPSSVDRVIRRTIRMSSSTQTVPATAAGTRQPTGPSPKTAIPAAISHFPSGGWTMNM